MIEEFEYWLVFSNKSGDIAHLIGFDGSPSYDDLEEAYDEACEEFGTSVVQSWQSHVKLLHDLPSYILDSLDGSSAYNEKEIINAMVH
jgi:hypothetical protein